MRRALGGIILGRSCYTTQRPRFAVRSAVVCASRGSRSAHDQSGGATSAKQLLVVDNRGSGARARGVCTFARKSSPAQPRRSPPFSSTWRFAYLAVAVVTFSAVAVGGAAIFFITT